MKLRFTPRHQQSRRNCRLHPPRKPALRVRASILQSLGRLLEFPRMGHRQTTPGVRKFVARRYHYIIYYSIDVAVDELIVLSVRHPAQRRPTSDV